MSTRLFESAFERFILLLAVPGKSFLTSGCTSALCYGPPALPDQLPGPVLQLRQVLEVRPGNHQSVRGAEEKGEYINGGKMCRFVFYKGRSSFLWLYSGRTFDKLFVAPLLWPSAFFQPHYPSFSSFTEDNRGSHSSPGINGQLNLPHIVNVASKLSSLQRSRFHLFSLPRDP